MASVDLAASCIVQHGRHAEHVKLEDIMSRTKSAKSDYASFREFLLLSPSEEVPDVVFVANAEDEKTGQATEVYAFKKPDGRFGQEIVPRERAFDPSALVTAIIAKNGQLPRDLEKAVSIVRRASSCEPREHWLHVAADGWQLSFEAFSHGGHVHRATKEASQKLKPPLSDAARKFPLSKNGTLDGWR